MLSFKKYCKLEKEKERSQPEAKKDQKSGDDHPSVQSSRPAKIRGGKR